MFIKYILRQQILIPPDEYTANSSKSIRNYIFGKYLFKIIKIPGMNNNESAEAICIRIQTIDVEDNIILRKSADMKVKVLIGVIVLRLIPGEYFEGVISSCSSQGVVVKFIGGLIQGTINIKNLHKDTIYNEDRNQWILTTGQQNAQGYQWKINAPVRFRIDHTKWNVPYEGPEQTAPSMADLVQLKANQAGLGPIQWWL